MFQKPFRTTRRKLLNPHTQESTDGAFRNQMILMLLSPGPRSHRMPSGVRTADAFSLYIYRHSPRFPMCLI